jgi:hypothetical protein
VLHMAAMSMVEEQERLTGAPDIPAHSSVPGGTLLDGWINRLVGVDDELVLRLWRRLLADSNAVSSFRSDNYLTGLRVAIGSPSTVPSDMNAAFVARSLLDCSENNPFLRIGRSESTMIGDAIRISGVVRSLRKVEDGWTLSISGEQENTLIRLRSGVFIQKQPRGLTKRNALVLGIVEKVVPRLELTGAALTVREEQ